MPIADNPSHSPQDRMQARLVEYEAGTSAYLSADSFPWQVGAVLLVPASILWGAVLGGGISVDKTWIGLSLVSLVFSVWYLYANHNRQIYRKMLRTLVEIESEFGMEFHRRFWETKDLEEAGLDLTEYQYILPFPRGRQLNYAFYLLGSLGGPVAAYFSGTGTSDALVWPVTITVVSTVIVYASNCSVREQLRKKRIAASPDTD